MTSEVVPSNDVDERRRAEMLAIIKSGDPQVANPALLESTYDDPDGDRVEPILLEHLAPEHDVRSRLLATTCPGHLARVHGKIARETVVPTSRTLLSDPVVGGTAQDAWTTSTTSPPRNRGPTRNAPRLQR
ncbi:hypothetical protein AB0H12_35570 [Actinosynnema sp. NPDC023794]